MVERAQALSRPWLDLRALIDLIDELRAAGYNVDVAHYVSAHDLLLALAARGEPLDDPQRLKNLLGPLFCSSPSEQEDFRSRFDRWAERLGAAIPARDGQAAALAEELSTVARGSRRWLTVAAISVVGAVTVTLAYILSRTTTVTRADPAVPLQLSVTYNWWIALPVLLAPVAALAGWQLWLRYRARLFLVRRATTQQPRIERVSVADAGQQILPPLLMFRIAHDFRRRVEVPSSELDVDATVARTVERAGWFTPVYARRQASPEYLVLIDRAAYGDHQARLASEMVAHLAHNGVLIATYYFEGDPRICFAAAPAAPLTLREVAARHGQHRLVIFSDARGLFSPRTGELELWTEIFGLWPDRALLTPEPPAQWGSRERELAQQFLVLPATPTGLGELVRAFQRDQASFDTTPGVRTPLPAELRARPRRWVARDAPDAALVERVLGQLRGHLGAAGYYWLSACAVYPALHWNLTLYLSGALRDDGGATLIEASSLIDLARLPWFRRGSMPDWLRTWLIAEMSYEQERSVRAALEALLITAVQCETDGLPLEIARADGGGLRLLARPLLRLLARRAPEDSPLRDYVFLSFMAGRRQRLAVQAPARLRELVLGRYRGDAGWWLWLKWTVASVLGWIAGWGAFIVLWNTRPVTLLLIAVGVALGLVSGIVQWYIVLWRYLNRSAHWIWVTLGGWTIGFALGGLLFNAMRTVIDGLSSVPRLILIISLFLILPAAIGGSAQAYGLHRQGYASRSWIVASILATTISTVATAVMLSVLLSGSSGAPGLGWALVCGTVNGLLYSLISGPFLLRILRRPPKIRSLAVSPERSRDVH